MGYQKLLILVVLFLGVTVMAQDYDRVDVSIRLYPSTFKKPEDLSKFIRRDFISDEEKVRAMYSWIINNISYDPDEYKVYNYGFKNYRERNEKEEKTREKIINRTIQTGKAVCEGYAMLLERLCELQGITSYLVRGDTKTNFQDIGREFSKGHMWNVIILDNQPYLFDPTWGAGKYHQAFIKDPTYYYYKTPPKQFFKSHYPDIYEDAFIEEIITREEFSLRPIIINQDLLYESIERPRQGIIRSEEYFGEIRFSILSPEKFQLSYSYGTEIIAIEIFEGENDRLVFNVPIVLGQDKLIIFFDGKPAIAYKVK